MRSDYTTAAGGTYYGTFSSTGPTAPPPLLQDWLASFAALPQGTSANSPCPSGQLPCVQIAPVVVANLTTPPTPVEIQVWWNDTRAGGATTTSKTTLPAALTVGTYKTVTEMSN